MKLIIDIPEGDYTPFKFGKYTIVGGLRGNGKTLMSALYMAIANATPLEKHDEEIIKETVKSIWGKPPYTEVLDSIKTEIEECKRYRGLTGNPIIDKHNVGLDKYYDLGLEKAIKIIDKYRGERNG